ncbi:hypothetical protein ACQKJZ_06510 [Sphingomonas sp. NPDC019816]|uniref:hypothetical protein n=1 Tax=Sphingomonas sp. NPDC019816 TaxID=3390679 RepID=UPI003D025986
MTTVQLVTWGLTATGTVVSLGWNLFNFLRSGRIAKTLREEQYQSAQWTRIRGKIDAAMEGLVDAVDALVAQVSAANGNTAAAGVIQQAVSQAHDKLAVELGDAAASAHCAGDDWAEAAYGTQHGLETSWDLVVAALETFDTANLPADRIAALKKARTYVGEIKLKVNDRLRIQDYQLDPARI